jgi:hypothetical protein
MVSTAISKNGKGIRLTDERWSHITEEHNELAGLRFDVLDALREPDRILLGNEGELLSVREINPGKDIVVVYREMEQDGFVITAFLTRRRKSLDRRTQLWP